MPIVPHKANVDEDTSSDRQRFQKQTAPAISSRSAPLLYLDLSETKPIVGFLWVDILTNHQVVAKFFDLLAYEETIKWCLYQEAVQRTLLRHVRKRTGVWEIAGTEVCPCSTFPEERHIPRSEVSHHSTNPPPPHPHTHNVEAKHGGFYLGVL